MAALLSVSFLLAAGAPTVVPAADWRSDLGLLRRALTELHPGLLRYQTQADFDRHFRDLSRKLDRDATRAEGFRAISEFLRPIACGHTYTNFFNQREETANELFGGRDKVPFRFRWIGDRMIVTRTLPGKCDLPSGTEIRRLNGVPPARILKTLMRIARADGANDGKRRRYLEITGEERFEAFDIYYPLYYPVREPRFELRVRRPGSAREETVSVPAIDLKERLADMAPKPRSVGPEIGWTRRMLDSKTAYVEMPGWDFYNTRFDWNGGLRDMFADLNAKGVPNLVLDIRNNEGGDDVGAAIAGHLAARPMKFDAIDLFVRYRKVPEDLNRYLETWDDAFRDWGAAAGEREARGYRLNRGEETALAIEPREPKYAGRVVVLMSETNSSATFQFVALMKRSKLATLVGQTSGGNQRGINGGAFFFLQLPKSKLEVDIPLLAYYTAGRPPNAGIEPDIRIRPTAEAIAAGRDLELEAALAYLRR